MTLFRSYRPCIAVTGPDRGGLFSWLFTRHAIRRAGGRAIRVTPSHPHDEMTFDGLVIGGGADVDPDMYGEEAGLPRPERERSLIDWLLALILYPLLFLFRRLFSTKHYTGLDKARDELETRMLCEAIAAHKPVLGICRGAQLINVHLDGTLHQDISGFYTESPQIWSLLPRKTIRVETGTLLKLILQTGSCRVNALHNQSINMVGTGLKVSAVEQNGVIQAIEGMNDQFLIGVQWHPEYLPHHARQRRLFSTLVEYSSDRGRQHGD